MVLPIPVPPATNEHAVRFHDMSSAKRFFDDLDMLFPDEMSLGFGGAVALSAGPPKRALLVVHTVGDFEASFVPSQSDFDRLDPRFRLAPDVWAALPGYADWGFCVFKLRAKPQIASPLTPPRLEEDAKPLGTFDRLKKQFFPFSKPAQPETTTTTSPVREFHPMAFEFPRRDSRLFFPTVHVHDGAVHPTASFDHALYCQLSAAATVAKGEEEEAWHRSAMPISSLPRDTVVWLDRESSTHRLQLIGNHPNRDVFVAEES